MPFVPEGSAVARDRLAYLFGSDRQSGLVAGGSMDLRNEGSTDLYHLRYPHQQADFVRLHIPGNFRRVRPRFSLDSVATVLNLITDPDLNPTVLGHAAQLLKSFPGRVLNRPEVVGSLARHQVARLLQGIDHLLVPKVARFRGRPNLAARAIEDVGLGFPAILRETGTHGGRIVTIVASLEELADLIEPARHYFLTEFVEMQTSAEGLYHKIRIYFFGAESFIRHRLVSDHWSVHAPDRQRVLRHHPAEIAAERALVGGGIAALPGSIGAALREARARISLDFFGMDFAVLSDGRALLFEANATMNFFAFSDQPPFEYFTPLLDQARAKFNAMLEGRVE